MEERVSSSAVRLCSLAELKKSGKVTRWVEELRDEVTALESGGRIHVFSSICPHFGGEFDVDCSSGQVRCRWHAWRFDVATGRCLNAPGVHLRHYPHSVQDDAIVLAL